jgi:Heparinase II/III-like protein/Heparinase II/III N-terminus
MNGDWVGKVWRGLRKPPGYIVRRCLVELRNQTDRWVGPWRAGRITADALAQGFGHCDLNAWWSALGDRPFFANVDVDPVTYETRYPGGSARILQLADAACAHRVGLLGSRTTDLGEEIDWHCDFKTGIRWAPQYCHDIEYNNPELPSDVKVPWEVSRLQWAMPLGQAYLLTGEERFAEEAKEILESWIAGNPYAGSVNWACTMEVALRIFTWTWLFHVFKSSVAWQSRRFRAAFLRMLYLKVAFTSRHLEVSDINGNHYTADAAGLVVGGLFFGESGRSATWADKGWEILRRELPLQVFDDGVDFEASVPYHRLVQELFLFPAMFRLARGLPVHEDYKERLIAMARVTRAYTKPTGLAPVWGDADDARALPFGPQDVNDHRYLIGLAGLIWEAPRLLTGFSGPSQEIFWLLGGEAVDLLPHRADPPAGKSSAFPDGGFFVLQNLNDHVFVDCGPVGLGGRGGHGHNDLLSFEAVLDGIPLVTDRGAFVYTADYDARNAFRSTASHNTPQVDGEEINRFVRPDFIWVLRNDANHEVNQCAFGDEQDRLVVEHSGYERLTHPVTVCRSYTLEHRMHRLSICDRFEGGGEHRIRVPMYLAPGVTVTETGRRALLLVADGRTFGLSWGSPSDWSLEIQDTTVSPSYGVLVPSRVLVWERRGVLKDLSIVIQPAKGSSE